MKADEELYGRPVELPEESDPGDDRKYRAKKPRSRHKWLVIGIILLVVIGIVVALAFRGGDNTESNPQEDNSAVNEEKPEVSQTGSNDVPEVLETETFTAGQPRLTLEHPISWTVEEKDGGVTAVSPDFTLETVTGESVDGYFKIYIRQGARSQDSTYIGGGVASLSSEKLTYVDPAPGQRKETNLSFFGLTTADHFAYFFIAGNFSLDKGDTLGPDYGKEPGTFIVAGGYASGQLEDDLATHKVGLDFFRTTKVYEQAMDIVKSLKLL